MSYRVDSSLSATDGSNSLVERCRSLEAALAQAQDFADALQRGVTASVFLLNVDADGVLRYVGFNQAHERLTGLSSEGVRGRRPTDLVPDVLTLGHALALERRYRNCVDMRTTVEYEEYLEIAGRPTWWVTSLSPLIDAEGRVARVVGSSWDITERKVAEDELRLAAT
ncbi:MAG: PAS domain-containing protein, partial [Burkholderiales bacterium]|nr:PAS domain-containing protein [Burkholderiales bacterium]